MTSPSMAALDLHREFPAIDLHADTLMWGRWLGYDVNQRHTPPLPRAALGGHVDIPRMRDGGMGAQFFGLVSLPMAFGTKGMARVVDEQIDELELWIAQGQGDLRLCHTGEDIRACTRDGSMGALLGIEGAHALEGDIDRLDAFARRGVRYLGLLHFSSNEAGFPAFGREMREEGLTRFGHALVERCEDLGVLVDLSHINRKGFMDACARATKPPIVSHTGVLGAFEHWRNIDDGQLKAVADRGGCVGVIFVPQFLGGDGLDPVVKHLKHIINVVGEDAPALGSDWDGFVVPSKGLQDPRGLPHLTDALLQANIPERAIGKLLSGNILRVLDSP